MKPKLGPLASLVVAVVLTVVCGGYVWFTADTQHRLSRNGVTATGQVTATRDPVGRFSVDSIDVRIPGYSEDFLVERFSGSPKVGHEIDVRYDREDPSRMVEDGVSVWGPFEYVMVFMGIAGVVSTVVELRRRPRRPRGNPFVPKPRQPNGGTTVAVQASQWAVKNGRRNRRR